MNISNCPRCNTELNNFYSDNYCNSYTCLKCHRVKDRKYDSNFWFEVDYEISTKDICVFRLRVVGWRIRYYFETNNLYIFNNKSKNTAILSSLPYPINLIYKSDDEITCWIKTILAFK